MKILRQSALLFIALALAACQSTGADPEPAPTAEAGAVPDMAAMQAMMAELGTPGEEHGHLAPMVGEWDAAMSFQMTPDAPPMESTGHCVNSWALGERFIETRYTGTFMGTPFEGRGFFGYDKARKTYCGFWIDNSGTQMMENSSGTYSPEDRTFRLSRQLVDPMSGTRGEMRDVIRIHSDDHHSFEIWMAMEGQEAFRAMRADYTRKR